MRFSRYNAGAKSGSNAKSAQRNSVLNLIIIVIMIGNGEIMVVVIVVVLLVVIITIIIIIGRRDFLFL